MLLFTITPLPCPLLSDFVHSLVRMRTHTLSVTEHVSATRAFIQSTVMFHAYSQFIHIHTIQSSASTQVLCEWT